MFIITLKKNAVINSMNCIGFKCDSRVIFALTEKSHPDCPNLIALAEYSNEKRAEQEFKDFVEALKLGKKYYEMTEEQ